MCGQLPLLHLDAALPETLYGVSSFVCTLNCCQELELLSYVDEVRGAAELIKFVVLHMVHVYFSLLFPLRTIITGNTS